MNQINSLTTRLIAGVLGTTAVISVTIFYIGLQENRETLERHASDRAEFAAEALVNEIGGMTHGIEQSTLTLGSIVQYVRPDPDVTHALLRSLLIADPAIFGVGIAYAPEAFTAGTDFAAYMYRDGDRLRYLDMASQQPAFRNQVWYRKPALTGALSWSEPYLDTELSSSDLVTYSIPVYDEPDGVRRLLAVLKADVALTSLSESIDALTADLSVMILSLEGRLVSAKNLEDHLANTPRDPGGVYTLPVTKVLQERGREDLRVVAEQMMRGKRLTQVLPGLTNDTRQWIHFMPLAETGWSAGVLVDERELFSAIKETEARELMLFVLNLVLISIIVVLLTRNITGPLRRLAGTAREIGNDPLTAVVPSIASRDEVGDLGEALRRMQVDLIQYVDELKSTMDAKQRLEGELAAAQQIQMAMLPNLPTNGRLIDGCDVAATLIPAKAVGGDLFDLIPLPDGRLMFMVGDVSDKGAAAALFMAKTVTLVNLLGREQVAPGELLTRLNRELCRENEACMFVTAICGVLDPASGRVVFANAGHNPPLQCSSDHLASYTDMPPGTALGIFEEVSYSEAHLELGQGELLLLYTDGVTEAVNHELELFGEARLESLPLQLFDTSRAIVEGVVKAVEDFAGGVEQADDITVLALRRRAVLPLKAETRMHGGVDSVASTQEWLASQLRQAGVEEELIGDLDLIADEVLANVIHHAYHDQADAEAWIHLEIDAELVRVLFSDAGPPFDPLVEAPEPDLQLPTEEREIGGLGILMVKRLADRVSYRRDDERNVLEVEKRRLQA
jgi:sigma-B regulation protein RsbU (phosphoserine phosphatase)